jgi:uracil-DNA glycosylase
VPDLRAFRRLLDSAPVPEDAEFLYDATSEQGALRRANLERYLALMAEAAPRVALVAEAPGWRGATVTGVPFLSMRELGARPGPITGAPDGDGFLLPAEPAAAWEASAAVVWRSLARWERPLPISWPVYPHHPFLAGDPRTNRTPRTAEVREGAPVALALLAAFEIRTVVAVGRKAQGALAAAGVAATHVRHPAQGGAALFAAQLEALRAQETGPPMRLAGGGDRAPAGERRR